MPHILAVCRVDRLLPDAGTVGITAIDKRPVEGPVKVRDLGLYADVQADRANHGGEGKAVYAYAQEDTRWWEQQLGREIPPGMFGENLHTTGLDLGRAVIGERWLVGGSLELEVTMPRTPCATFQRRMGEEHWVRRFAEEARTGTYLRVVRRGQVTAGDEVVVASRPEHGVTIRGWFTEQRASDARALLDAEQAGGFRIADDLREYVDRVMRRHDA